MGPARTKLMQCSSFLPGMSKSFADQLGKQLDLICKLITGAIKKLL